MSKDLEDAAIKLTAVMQQPPKNPDEAVSTLTADSLFSKFNVAEMQLQIKLLKTQSQVAEVKMLLAKEQLEKAALEQ